MANGPLGGFMPTPPAPGQPPQVSLNTSAESRGKFNNFLGTLPKNGAIAPIQTGVGLSSPMPVSPIASNVNIFQPQMSQMTAMPMMPPAQPVQMMFNGGEAGDFSDFAGFDDPSDPFGIDDSGQEDTSDSFDANMGLSNQEVQNIFGGDDPTPPPLPTPRPDVLKEAVSRAEKEIFGGTESDALKFFNDQGGLSSAGQRAFDDAIKGNLVALQEPEVAPVAPAGGGLQLASLLDNRLIPGDAKSVSPGDLSKQGFLGVSPTRSIDTGKGLSTIPDLTLDQDLLQQKTKPTDDIQKAYETAVRERVEIPANISFRNLIQATTPGTPEYEATKGGDLTSIISPPGSSPFFGTPLMQRNLQEEVAPVTAEEIQAANQLSDLQAEASPFSVPLAPVPGLTSGLVARDTVTDREADTIQEITERNQDLARSIANRGLSVEVDPITGKPDVAPTVDNLLRLGREAQATRRDKEAAAQALGVGTPPQVQGPPRLPDTVLDIDTILPEDDALTTVSPDVLSSIGREQRIDDANTFRSTVPDAAKIFGDRKIQTTPIDFASVVGSDVEPSLEIADIQGDVNQEAVADILSRPDRFKETFNIGDAVFPNLLATLANKAGSFFDRRLFDGIVSKGLDAVVDPDTGRIIGAKDEFGNLIEGRDLEQFKAGDDDNQDPITKFLKKATEEKEEKKEDEKPPNVIGGTTPTEPTPRPPTVVPSKFPASTASFTPVGFNTGSLNDLIARITGVPAPRTLQEGGVVNAVDNFLTKVA